MSVAGFGFSTAQRRDLGGLGDDLARIGDAGATFAELSLCGMDVVANGRPVAARVRELGRLTAAHRLRYTAHGPLAANFMDPRHAPLFRRVVEAYLAVCDTVGARVLVLHTGIVPRRPQAELDQLHAREREALRFLGDAAGRLGIKIAIETLFAFEPDRYTATPSRLAAEIEAVDHPHVVGCLDLGHCYLYATHLGLDLETEVSRFAAVTGHVHIHDNFGLPQTVQGFLPSETMAFGLGDLHLPLGWGDLPFGRLLPKLKLRPDTAVIDELPPHFAVDTAACAETLRSWLPTIGDETGT